MAHVTDEDIKRLLKIKDADFGFFILATHSLMERALKDDYNPDLYFGELIGAYLDNFKEKYGTPQYQGASFYNFPKDKQNIFNELKGIPETHNFANTVRHVFAIGDEDKAKQTISHFIAFAKAQGWYNLISIKQLEKDLEDWKTHDGYQSPELKKAIAEISRLKSENQNLAQKANELTNLQNQLATISAREKAVRSELLEKEASLSKKDEKLNSIRQKANEQYMQFRKEKEEILAKIKDYEQTKQYLEVLEQVAFYTKTRHDYEQSIISLSREQADVLNQINLNKDFLIKGAAGTGKSFVLIRTLEKAMKELSGELSFEENQNHFRLLTYTKSLVKYNQYVTKILNTQVPEESITTADSFLASLLKAFFPRKKLGYKYDDFPEEIFDNADFKGQEIFTEAQNFIWANCITRAQYVDEVCDREGMKFPLKKSERVAMWNALEAVEAKLEKHNCWPRNYMAKKIAEHLDAGGPDVEQIMAEYSFVDEAQDLPPVILSVIKKSTKRAVFLAGDSDQSIYTKGFNWNRSGIDIQGRTKILKTNFRNTAQIHEYAEKYRSSFTHKDTTTMPDAYRPGPPVEQIVARNNEDLQNQIVEQVRLLMNALNYAEENICIIANTKDKLKGMKDILDKKLGIEANIIEDYFDFESVGGIRLCTMQNCKGLDFPVVLFIADHRVRGAEESSVYDEETFMSQQYNMVYVALTRAMEMLYVYTLQTSQFEPFKRLESI
jgi:hypothetical protein